MEFSLKFTGTILKNQQQQNRPPYKCFASYFFISFALKNCSTVFLAQYERTTTTIRIKLIYFRFTQYTNDNIQKRSFHTREKFFKKKFCWCCGCEGRTIVRRKSRQFNFKRKSSERKKN